MDVAAIICAAGRSKRFGGKKRKPFVDVDGRAMFLRSIEVFASRQDVKQIILAILPEDREWLQIKWGANLGFFNVQVCEGGEHRPQTVQKALALVKGQIELVAIHDAARCCITAELVEKTIAAAARFGAAIPACPVSDTLKQVKSGMVVTTIPRDGLYEAQTPQVFKLDLIRKAYQALDHTEISKIYDDAQLVEAMGHQVAIVQSDPSNIKVTFPTDIPIAEAIIRSRRPARREGPLGPFEEAQW
ncbi:MAG: 2-C-methyl-D-erythritol 4-phosphate cytidylyltransferase [Sedimentisphaerales bacterium]|nr:2-C-methyl-D-erythritol 4-phosphate cytidylyltransferase [Sedimentisphaerales bacterium]